ncbi:MAG: DUF89 family protein [Candidatus Omnitrophica bacterium]|nr:DUF89 family protein [Candidatus Omnitrophota bacterium]
MKTYLDCIPCFFKQALYSARMSKASKKTQKAILEQLARTIQKISLKFSPPEMARIIHKQMYKLTKEYDPYKKVKLQSNKMALKIFNKLKRKVSHSQDRLLMATELAIAGNIIDYGAKHSLSVDNELKKILNYENKFIKKEGERLFNYQSFKRVLKRAKTILYLADNAGETVFDRVLIEEIKKMDTKKEIVYAVKEKPAINDALIEDALFCGIDKSAKVISSGVDAPGTVLSLCSKEFLKLYRKADMVISKGQGNFEALSAVKRPIFFMFMAKCPVIAREVNCEIGNIILLFKGKK